jgi:hypothetical protein
MAMTQLGNGLGLAGRHEDALSVQEAELAMMRRHGASEELLLGTQSNLAATYSMLGRKEEALRLQRDVYHVTLNLYGKENEKTILQANNYAAALGSLQRVEEAKALLRKTVPVARRVLGECDETALKVRFLYAKALYADPDATLADLRVSVTTLEDTAPIAKRVMGGAHPTTAGIEKLLRNVRAVLRDTPPTSK